MERDISKEMWEALPEYYQDVFEMIELIKTKSIQFNQTNLDIQDIINQFFIDTATWMLPRYEKIYGIETDESKTYEERRSVIKAKKRGVGTVTTEMIKNVAESYENGEVEVIPNPSQGTITIKYNSQIGIPSRLDAIQGSIRAIIPAHLDLVFDFKYLRINEIHEVKTLQQMEALTLDQFAGGA